MVVLSTSQVSGFASVLMCVVCACVCVTERECVFKAFMSEMRKEMEERKCDN